MPENDLNKLEKQTLIELVEQLRAEVAALSKVDHRDIATGGGAYVESGISTGEGGDAVMRDKNVQIIETLNQYISPAALHPERLGQALEKMIDLQNAINEWKQVHDYLDAVLVAFGQFEKKVKPVEVSHRLPKLRELKNLWTPVSVAVDKLHQYACKITKIGVPYAILENNEPRGEPWAVEVGKLRDYISGYLGYSPSLPAQEAGLGEGYPNQLQKLSFRLFGWEIDWWQKIDEYTQKFESRVASEMTHVNKQLRNSATELYNLSSQLFITGLVSGEEKDG